MTPFQVDPGDAAPQGGSLPQSDMRPPWSYDEAFCRNLGLISRAEQEVLRNSRVAVAGLGGVGGVDLVALARLGVGKFSIADPDIFEMRNTNRQYGAMRSSEGRSKADVMCAIVRDINPEAEIRVFHEPLGRDNVDAFLEGADVLVDGIDAFEIGLRRLLFSKARQRGIHGLGAGPVGFSTVWVIFSPQGMSFDRYFDLSDRMNPMELFAAYVVGMAPSMLQRKYMDISYLDFQNHTGPSAGLSCHLASGVVAAEVLKILLHRGQLRVAPFYHQFDAYRGRYVCRRLLGGNLHPLQQIKRYWLVKYLMKRMKSAGQIPAA